MDLLIISIILITGFALLFVQLSDILKALIAIYDELSKSNGDNENTEKS
jgi:hypothetical protein